MHTLLLVLLPFSYGTSAVDIFIEAPVKLLDCGSPRHEDQWTIGTNEGATKIIEKQDNPKGCASGLFSLEGHEECYKVLKEAGEITWREAGRSCSSEGLALAQPPHESAPSLQKYILDNYGHHTWVWLGARRATPDSEVVWQQPLDQQQQRQGVFIHRDSEQQQQLWWSHAGPDSDYYSTRDDVCVFLMVSASVAARAPASQTYGVTYCGTGYLAYPLCQAF